jgi:hypothetical protein
MYTTAVRRAAKPSACSKIIDAVLRSAARDALSVTFDIFPIRAKLKVPIKPNARQNFLRDCTKPTEKIVSGRNIPSLIDGEALVVIKPIKALTLKKSPTTATI